MAFRHGAPGQLQKLELPKPEPFKTDDGKSGWKLKIPNGRLLGSPAVADGILYVGGGFSSYSLYALDARTGERVWSYQTGDNGPSGLVVDEGCLGYTTESCTIYVHDARTGRLLWCKWLGDPLTSQPAIADGRLFAAYPGKGGEHLAAFRLRSGAVQWDRRIAGSLMSAPVIEGPSLYAATTDGTLYHLRVATGTRHWSARCAATSAPAVVDGRLFFSQRAIEKTEIAVSRDSRVAASATVEGYNVADARKGYLSFKTPQSPTPAPYLLTPQRAADELAGVRALRQQAQQTYRTVARRISDEVLEPLKQHAQAAFFKERLDGLAAGASDQSSYDRVREAEDAVNLADGLDRLQKAMALSSDPDARAHSGKVKAGAALIRDLAEKAMDATKKADAIEKCTKALAQERGALPPPSAAAASSAAPARDATPTALDNIGVSATEAVWAYQGSRPTVEGRMFFSVNGSACRAMDLGTGKVVWESTVESKAVATRPVTPPALAGGKLYLGTADGRLLCVSPKTGRTIWEASVGGKILVQPIVAKGRVYAVSEDGLLICLETGDPMADGWPMWGGSARHNGPERKGGAQ